MSERPTNLSATEALQKLQEGNQRYVNGCSEHPHQDSTRRESLVGGQHPFAVILACADSRVSPEVIFDVGLGDIFVIRVAGNIVDESVKGSIEYACLHLGVNCILVLGHQSCGAVAAATSVDNHHNHIDDLLAYIRPPIAAVKNFVSENDGNYLKECIKANATYGAAELRHCEVALKDLAEEGLEVFAGYYNLDSGVVDLF